MHDNCIIKINRMFAMWIFAHWKLNAFAMIAFTIGALNKRYYLEENICGNTKKKK